MHTAERNRELVADLPAQRSGLSEAEMVGICRLSTAHEAGLRGDKRQMVLVPSPARLAVHEDGALAICLRISFGGLKESRRLLWGISVWQKDPRQRLQSAQLGFERILNSAGIFGCEGVLG